ncbi:zinc finger protein 541-like isoform X3 [Oscarella lobularis]
MSAALSSFGRPIDDDDDELPGCAAGDPELEADPDADVRPSAIVSTFPRKEASDETGGGGDRKKFALPPRTRSPPPPPPPSSSSSSSSINPIVDEEREVAETTGANAKETIDRDVDDDSSLVAPRQHKTRSSSVSSQRGNGVGASGNGGGGGGGGGGTHSPVHMTRGATRRLSQSSPELAPTTATISLVDSSARRKENRQMSAATTAAMTSVRSQQTIAVGEREDKSADLSGSLQKATAGQKRRYSGDETDASESSKMRRRRSVTPPPDESSSLLWQKQIFMQQQPGWLSGSGSMIGDRASAFSTAAAAAAFGRTGPDLPVSVESTIKSDSTTTTTTTTTATTTNSLFDVPSQMLRALKEYGLPPDRTKKEFLRRDEVRSVRVDPNQLLAAAAAKGELKSYQKSSFRSNKSSPTDAKTGDPALECEVCHRRFAAASGLGKHRLTHAEDKRYSCTICNKGFKRQDHLTNHMLTHRERKPFRCQVGDCQKSYCDLRSLKRHTESHHGRTALDDMVKNWSLRGSASAVAGGNDGRRSPLPLLVSSSNEEKNVSIDHGSGTEVGHHVPDGGASAAAPASPPPQQSKQQQVSLIQPPPPLTKISPRLDSASMSSAAQYTNAAAAAAAVAAAAAAATTPAAAAAAATASFPFGYPAQTQLPPQSGAGGSGTDSNVAVSTPGFVPPPSPYSFASNPSGRSDYLSMFPPGAAAVTNWQYFLAAAAYHPYLQYGFLPPPPPHPPPPPPSHPPPPPNVLPPPTVAPAPPVTSSSTSTSASSSVVPTAYSTPTSSPAVKVKKEKSSPAVKVGDASKHSVKNGSKSTGYHGQVQCPICERYFKNVKSLNGHLRLHGGYEGANRAAAAAAAQARNASHPDRREKTSTKRFSPASTAAPTSSSSTAAAAAAAAATAPSAFQTLLQAIEVTKRKEEEHGADGNGGLRSSPPAKRRKPGGVHFRPEPEVFNRSGVSSDDSNFESPSPPDLLSRRRRRPENLNLRASHHERSLHDDDNEDDEDYYPRPTTPPPYTPPPMLSPRLSMSGSASPLKSPRMTLLNTPLPNTPRVAMTPGSAKFNLPWMPRRISTGEGGTEEQITLTPKINVGSQFQAEVPPFATEESRIAARKEKHQATLVWSSSDERDQEELVEAYLDLACSNMIRYCGQNKEYALHVLHQNKGDIQASVRCLLSGSSLLKDGDPLRDYHYSGSTRWTRPERQKFRQAWRLYGKQFLLISNAMEGLKSTREIIEYYYRWKKYCNTEYRGRTRHESDDFDSDEELQYNGPPFECEYPDCGASFASRQSLNGHIRIHGGKLVFSSFVYRMETRRSRPRNGARTRFSASPVAAEGVGGVDDESPFPPSAPASYKPDSLPSHSGTRVRMSDANSSNSLQPMAPLLPFFNPQSVLPPPPLAPQQLPPPSQQQQVQFSPDGKTFIPPHYTAIAPAPNPPARGHSGGGRGRRGGAGRNAAAATTTATAATTSTASSNLDGKVEFKCKVCGRVFSKVKSRSAHMKIHSTRSEEF